MSYFTKQTPIRVIGVIRQLFGGAMTWVTAAIFVFSGITFWDSPTIIEIRSFMTWLSLPVFALIIAAGLLILMWLEHKFVQPAIMGYWNKMFYEQDNPMTAHLARIERKIDALADKDNRKP
jgi:hypothetical protein